MARRVMTKPDVASFMAALAASRPAPQTELVYGSDFQLLVAVVLSAQTTDRAVNLATPGLFAAAPDAAAMAALGVAAIGERIRTIGLWQAKARHVAALSAQLVARHGGAVPGTRTELEALPGVGRKTANVVLNVAFGQPTLAVDTHIFRIGNRTGLAPGANPRAVEDGLMGRIPPAQLGEAHHWLILHGRYVCKARAPLCAACPAFDPCRYPDKEAVRARQAQPPPRRSGSAGQGRAGSADAGAAEGE